MLDVTWLTLVEGMTIDEADEAYARFETAVTPRPEPRTKLRPAGPDGRGA